RGRLLPGAEAREVPLDPVVEGEPAPFPQLEDSDGGHRLAGRVPEHHVVGAQGALAVRPADGSVDERLALDRHVELRPGMEPLPALAFEAFDEDRAVRPWRHAAPSYRHERGRGRPYRHRTGFRIPLWDPPKRRRPECAGRTGGAAPNGPTTRRPPLHDAEGRGCQGRRTAPSSESVHPGLWATSQGCPSGSTKTPE